MTDLPEEGTVRAKALIPAPLWIRVEFWTDDDGDYQARTTVGVRPFPCVLREYPPEPMDADHLKDLLERYDADIPTETPDCQECGDPAEHSVPRAPGMGNEHYCEDCCPRCNFGSAIGGNEEA